MFKKVRRLSKEFAIDCYNVLFNRPIGIIYMLHRIGPKEFDRLSCIDELRVSTDYLQHVVDSLRPSHDFISLYELPNRMGHYPQQGQRPFVIFTIDDGYRDNYTYGLPFFRRNNIPFTIFLTYNFIGNPRPFNWPFLLERMLVHHTTMTLSDGTYIDCSTSSKKNDAFIKLKSHIMAMPYINFEQSFCTLFSPYLTENMYEDNMLTWEQVRAMQASGLCSFGAHTMSHCRLSKVPAVELTYELEECRHMLSAKLAQSIKWISYPFGWVDDISSECVTRAIGGGIRMVLCRTEAA